MGNLYDDNPRLFKALNILKANSIVYERYNPEEYKALREMRADADRVLSCDGCRIDINTDIKAVYICFLPNDEYTNHLRARFSANDMKVYVCLLQLYEERFNVEGPFVVIAVEELEGLIRNTGFNLGGIKKAVSRALLNEHLRKFSRYGIVKKHGSSDWIINPGVLTCVSRTEFNSIYNSCVKPWLLIDNPQGEEDADDAENITDTELQE